MKLRLAQGNRKVEELLNRVLKEIHEVRVEKIFKKMPSCWSQGRIYNHSLGGESIRIF